MGLLSKVADALGGNGGRTDVETFGYRCASCGTEFETPKNQMVGVRCPDCGSADVRPAD